MQRAKWGLVALAGTLAAAFSVYRPDLAVRVATGVSAHDICSKTFTSGLDPEMLIAETGFQPGIRRLRALLAVDVDLQRRRVRSTVGGMFASEAQFHPGRGCTLEHLASTLASVSPGLPAPTASPLVQPANARLAAALERGFAEPSLPPPRRTKAIVVLKDGQLIGERYAAGIDRTTQLLGFSLSKSVTNALLGRLVHQGRLSVDQVAPIALWRTPGDSRGNITIEHLLRMTSGLALDETNSGFDPSSRIVYLEPDMAAAAAQAAVIASPGTRYAYSSPSTILLARIIGDTIGGGPDGLAQFARRELFEPLGMNHVTLEFDAAGTFLGNAYVFASARDWARFGQLYLDDGVANGRRLLPESWVDFSARATLGTYYGAGFWTLRSAHPWSKRWAELGIPSDAFFASGHLGQRVIVLPTQRLIIARLGDSIDQTGDFAGFARLVADVIAATQ